MTLMIVRAFLSTTPFKVPEWSFGSGNGGGTHHDDKALDDNQYMNHNIIASDQADCQIALSTYRRSTA